MVVAFVRIVYHWAYMKPQYYVHNGSIPHLMPLATVRTRGPLLPGPYQWLVVPGRSGKALTARAAPGPEAGGAIIYSEGIEMTLH